MGAGVARMTSTGRIRRGIGIGAAMGLAVAGTALSGGAGVAGAESTVVGCQQAGPLATCTFQAAGEFAFEVPKGVTTMTVTATGAGGQDGLGAGGLGGKVTGDITVTPGTKIYFLVGQGGGSGASAGGGLSGVSTQSVKADATKGYQSLLIAAPGGGGAGTLTNGGNPGVAGAGAAGGKAGTKVAGGAGGTGTPDGQAGAQGTGGAGIGGGGGAGYFGGGGGAAGGAGGGGSYLIPVGGTDKLADKGARPQVYVQFYSWVPITLPGLDDIPGLGGGLGDLIPGLGSLGDLGSS